MRILLQHVLSVKRLLLMTYYYNSTNLILTLYMYILIGTTICPACTYSLYSQVSIITSIQNHCHISTSLMIRFCLSKSNMLIIMDNVVYHKLTSFF